MRGAGEQRLRVDRQAAGTELDPELQVDPVTRRSPEPVAGRQLERQERADVATSAANIDEAIKVVIPAVVSMAVA